MPAPKICSLLYVQYYQNKQYRNLQGPLAGWVQEVYEVRKQCRMIRDQCIVPRDKLLAVNDFYLAQSCPREKFDAHQPPRDFFVID